MTETGAALGSSDDRVVYLDVDEEDFPALWALLPHADEVLDMAAWSVDAGAVFVRDRQLDEDESLEFVRAMLADLVVHPTAFADSLRFLFMPDPEWGGVLWEVAFARPDDDRSWPSTARDLVGADVPAELGQDVSEFKFNGISGLLGMRFRMEGGEGGSRSIAATATVAVRRELPEFGVCDIVGFTDSAQLEPLAMSLEAMQRLLCSEYFAGLLGPS